MGTLIHLLFAGHETTTSLIATGLHTLLRHPQELARMRADPALVKPGIEELLRYESPVQLTPRWPLEGVELRGRKIDRGDAVVALIGAANRDPDEFADPERVDVSRQPNRHLSFGAGIHFCLGAPLARVEAQIAFKRLLEMQLELEEPAAWRDLFVLRGLESLQVAIGSAA